MPLHIADNARRLQTMLKEKSPSGQLDNDPNLAKSGPLHIMITVTHLSHCDHALVFHVMIRPTISVVLVLDMYMVCQ